MPDVGLTETWRKVAVERWYDSQDHVGQADTDPEPYVEAAADAAVRVVLEHLFDVLTKNEYGRTEAYEDAVLLVEALIEQAKP